MSLGLEARDPEPSCSVQECRDGREEEVQYVVKEVREEGQCCPTRERVGCRDHQDRQRVEGEQWFTDPCTSHTCGRMEGRLEVEVTSLNCTKECPPGSSYSPGLEGQCCGSCSLVADCATVAGQGGQVGGLRIQVTSLPWPASSCSPRCRATVSAPTPHRCRAGRSAAAAAFPPQPTAQVLQPPGGQLLASPCPQA